MQRACHARLTERYTCCTPGATCTFPCIYHVVNEKKNKINNYNNNYYYNYNNNYNNNNKIKNKNRNDKGYSSGVDNEKKTSWIHGLIGITSCSITFNEVSAVMIIEFDATTKISRRRGM